MVKGVKLEILPSFGSFRCSSLSLSLSLSKINNPSVIACGAIPYFIYAMSHNLEGNYYEYVVYHPALRDKERRGLIIEIKLIRNFARFIHSYIKWNFRNTSCRWFRFITRVYNLKNLVNIIKLYPSFFYIYLWY